VTDLGDQLRLELVYDQQAFSPGRAEELLAQFVVLLSRCLEQPGQALKEVSLVTTGGRRVIADPALPLEPTAPVPGLLEGVRRNWHSTVVQDDGRILDGEGLERAVAAAVAVLQDSGIETGDVVAVLAARTAPLVPVLLALRASGATIVLLEPSHPPARLMAQLKAAGACALVHFAAANDDLPFDLRVAVPLALPANDLLTPSRTAQIAGPLVDRSTGEQPAFVLFTSGSTGPVPRGVVSTERPLAHFLDWYVARFRLGPSSRFALLAGLGHDPLLRDVFGPLWSGGSLDVPKDDLLRKPVALAEWLADRQTTVVHLTPPLARMLAAAAIERGLTLPHVELVCYGGDILRGADVVAMAAICPKALHVNAYGATETPQIMGHAVVDPAAAARCPAAAVPIGTGIDGVQLLVEGPAGLPAAIGEPGQIVVRTRHLAEGYLAADPAGAFRDDQEPGVRRYATGDRGRYRPDGQVEFLGRVDHQVKIRGFRVDPTEVDALCRQHPWVREAVTVPCFSPGADTWLATYVVLRTGVVDAVQVHLETVLPEHMVPQVVIELDALPLTVNGKVDFLALPAPQSIVATVVEPPNERVFEMVSEIWCEVLNAGKVGPHDNFFDLGGTSRAMVRVQMLLRERLGREVTLVSLFQHANIHALVRYLTGEPAASSLAAPRPRARRHQAAAARLNRLKGRV
jgi:amino acid adenylation domain-containing protein